jgi:hypothetical protein
MFETPVNWHCRTFQYRDVTVSVSTADPTQLSWLEEFLCPQFAIIDGGSPNCHVSVVMDTRQYIDTFRRGPRPDGRHLDCFALDTGLVRLPAWKPLDATQVIFDPDFKLFYLVNPDRSRVRILAPRGSLSVRTALMRVVREFAMTSSVRAGALIIHGAAFGVGDRGVVIAGPKKAGKTTLLIHVLQHVAARFVSNDRVVVAWEDGVPTLYGMPTIVTVRQQGARRLRFLHERLLASSYHERYRLAELGQRIGRARRPDQYGRWSMSPAQFCELLRVRPIAQVPAYALVFPRVTGQPGTIELNELLADDAAVQLAGALFRAHSSLKTAEMLTSSNGTARDRAAFDNLCRQLASGVRSFTCALGREAYQSGDSVEALVTRMIGSE